MFDNLTNRFSQILENIRFQSCLTKDNIKDALREVRMSLLDADVAFPVVLNFIDSIRKKAVGQEINKGLTPKQEFIKIVYHELLAVMGNKNQPLNLAVKQKPSVVLIAGLQGVGKTTSVAKLGKLLREKYKKKVLVVSTDVYRPSAITQLKILALQAMVDSFSFNVTMKPIDIAKAAIKEARSKSYEVLLVDTAGRMHINKPMMDEIKKIHEIINPIETLFVIDAMTGQDAVNTAKVFNETLPLTGIILTKVDGDARGGAALSVRCITGKPIKFIGIGEKIEEIEPFHPNRIASRILGMGDIISLIETIENKIDRTQSEKLINKLKKGNDFTLIDFLDQCHQIKKIGGITSLLDKLPTIGAKNNNNMVHSIKKQIDDKVLMQAEAIINSMTYKERINPGIINSSRKRRIALGCGMKVQDVNLLLKQFNDMQRTIKKIKKDGLMGVVRNLKEIIPPGFLNR